MFCPDHSNRCIFPRAPKSFLFFVVVASREKLILVRCRTNPHDSWLRFCQLIRRIGHPCASSLPVFMRDFRGMVVAGDTFAVSHAVFVHKIINFANP